MVNYDGFYLSFLAEGVRIPPGEEVDHFLAPLKDQPERPRLIPGQPLGCGTHGIDRGFVELRYKHSAAMERAKGKFDEIDSRFGKFFGRSYGGQIEEYRMSDADIALVISGSATGTAKTIIDMKREAGIKVGLVKIRMFRPFPQERLIAALQGKKALGVVDRSICFGWDSGPTHTELRAIGTDIGPIPILGFIGGLANMDISTTHLEEMVDRVLKASRGEPYEKVTWMNLEE
jgi:pyruvate/2-oxoacid:ferredoxin oxidoreductase alpha subunit